MHYNDLDPTIGVATAFVTQENGQSLKVNIDGVDLEPHTSDPNRVTHYGPEGLATNIFPVPSKALANLWPGVAKDGMVAKIFWVEEQRTGKPDILKKVEEIANKHSLMIKGRVPDLLLHHKFEEPTSEVREMLGTEPIKGSHVPYILVFRKLQPITELRGKDFFNVWQQCIECHFDLWHAGFLHRDVSPPNLIYHKDGKGKMIGVLNDFDLSSLANGLGPQGNERTGTMPFMALDLLTEKIQQGKVEHLYRHDLESFMWILPWVVLRDGKLLTSDRPLDDWATKDALTVYLLKSAFQNDFLDLDPTASDPLMWSLAFDCLNVLRSERNRRGDLWIKQWKRNGGISITGIERDDAAFLDLFRSSDTWIELSTSLQ